MNRYIEIVYDNSGSMKSSAGKKIKYEIAQELFEKEILPLIALPDDEVVLRCLGDNCNYGMSISYSLTSAYGTDRKAMLAYIKGIAHEKSTPLFYTIADAIEACRSKNAAQHLIFVLTDGDDTCNVKIEDVIGSDLIARYVRFYNVLLVQLAVDSPLSSNNLTAMTSYLGGQSIQLNSDDSIIAMRTTIRKGLQQSGFSTAIPLSHCYRKTEGPDLSWAEIESRDISFHQALLLYQKDYLSWKPDWSKNISATDFSELEFLTGLCYKTALPDTLCAAMLAQLKKPYYYSHDCIYWDFKTARWKYFIPQNQLHRLENPEVLIQDKISIEDNQDFEEKNQSFDSQKIYEVVEGGLIDSCFALKETERKARVKTLKNGDLVQFKRTV